MDKTQWFQMNFLTCQWKKIWYTFISKLKISNLQIYFNYAAVLQILIHRIKYIFDLTICYKAFWFIKFYQKRFRCKFRFWFKYLKKSCIIQSYTVHIHHCTKKSKFQSTRKSKLHLQSWNRLQCWLFHQFLLFCVFILFSSFLSISIA